MVLKIEEGAIRPRVLAFGGHALREDDESLPQLLSTAILRLLPEGSGMVLVHGNGPQVGRILLRVETTKDRIPGEPLDVLVAETQGSIGYHLSRSIRNGMMEKGKGVEVATVLTQVVVDPKDPAFSCPTKPVDPIIPLSRPWPFKRGGGWPKRKENGRGWCPLLGQWK
jgi:carbamate kinase